MICTDSDLFVIGWLKCRGEFLKNTKVPRCWYFSDGKIYFLRYVDRSADNKKSFLPLYVFAFWLFPEPKDKKTLASFVVSLVFSCLCGNYFINLELLPIGSENFEKFFFIIYYLVFIIIFLGLKFKIKKNGYFNEKKSEQWNFLMMATIFEKKRGDCSSYSGECFDKISSDNKDYLLPQFAYKYNLVSWLSSERSQIRESLPTPTKCVKCHHFEGTQHEMLICSL